VDKCRRQIVPEIHLSANAVFQPLRLYRLALRLSLTYAIGCPLRLFHCDRRWAAAEGVRNVASSQGNGIIGAGALKAQVF
jgi:hypothetical protein